MGVFNNYAIVPADKFMPVDVHVPGCPPRPEALMHGILKLRGDDPAATRTSAGARATAVAAPRSSSESELQIDPAAAHTIGVSGGGKGTRA